MTDREMLELAAKAAGWFAQNWAWVEGEGFVYQLDGRRVVWNPLTDDGDAFRLMVKMGLDVETHGGKTWHPYAGAFDCNRNIAFEVQPEDGDIFAATRRAITRAAAEIGRNMK